MFSRLNIRVAFIVEPFTPLMRCSCMEWCYTSFIPLSLFRRVAPGLGVVNQVLAFRLHTLASRSLDLLCSPPTPFRTIFHVTCLVPRVQPLLLLYCCMCVSCAFNAFVFVLVVRCTMPARPVWREEINVQKKVNHEPVVTPMNRSTQPHCTTTTYSST